MNIRPLLLMICGVTFAVAVGAVSGMQKNVQCKVVETGLFYSEQTKQLETQTITTDLGSACAIE